MLKIEEGKYYKTRDGRKVGPAKWSWGKFEFDGSWSMCHEPDGTYCGRKESERDLDLIAEWTDGPVVTETVTKTRIVPGVYDGVSVQEVAENDRGEKCADIGFELAGLVTADELDAAAAVLSALAKGLRDA